jgi:hypothetical protein
MRVPSSSVVIACLLALASGCTREATGPEPQPSPTAATPSTQEVFERKRAAHTEALQHARPLAEEVLLAADPLAAWAIGRGPLRPRPHPPVSFSALVERHARADRELADVSPDFLDPEAAVVRASLGFGLRRIGEYAGGHAPTRTDPLFALLEAHQFLDAFDRARLTTPDDELRDALAALDVALRVDYRDLGAASAVTLDAAIEDFAPLVARVEAIAPVAPALAETSSGLAETARQTEAQLRAQRDALPAAPNVDWSKWPPPAGGAPRLLRLPDAIGRAALTRRLEIDEGLDRNVAEAIPQLLTILAQLDRVDAASARPVEGSPPTPVTTERCEGESAALLERLGPPSSGGDSEAPGALDCTWVRSLLRDAPRTDAELRVELLHRGWIAPIAIAQRRASPEWIASISGGTVGRAHRELTAVTLAMRLEDPATVALASTRMRETICATVAGIWVHAELPDPDKLTAWLRSDCTSREPEVWIAGALARPRVALEGLAHALAAGGPSGAAMMSFAPWAPLGLVPAYADPTRAPAEPPLALDFEPLDDFLDDPN